MKLSNFKLKNFLYFRKKLPWSENQKSIFIKQAQKKKVSYTFPYKEAKFSKLKYFLIIIMKCFFSVYSTFVYTKPVVLFFCFCFSYLERF